MQFSYTIASYVTFTTMIYFQLINHFDNLSRNSMIDFQQQEKQIA